MRSNRLTLRTISRFLSILAFAAPNEAYGREERSTRVLPNITTIYYTPETPFPTASPTRMARSTRLIVCSSVKKGVVSVPTDVDFYYRLEMNALNSSQADPVDIASVVSGAAIDKISSAICRETETNGEGSRLLALNGCLKSISAGTDDARIVSCTPEATDSTSCAWYRGSLRLLHTEDCSAGAITSAVLSALSSIVVDDFLDLVNPTNSDVNVTNVAFAEVPQTSSSVTAATFMSSNESRRDLTLGGFIMVLLTALTLACASLLLFFACRGRTVTSSDQASKCADEDADKAELDRTLKLTDDGSYIGPNWGNLGGSHSSVDSHRCTSSTCNLCRMEMNGVRMLDVNVGDTEVHLEGLRTFSNDEDDKLDSDDDGDEELPTGSTSRGAGRGGFKIHGFAEDETPRGGNNEADGDDDSCGHDNYEVTLEEQEPNVAVDAGMIGNDKVRFVRFFGWTRSQPTDVNKSLEL